MIAVGMPVHTNAGERFASASIAITTTGFLVGRGLTRFGLATRIFLRRALVFNLTFLADLFGRTFLPLDFFFCAMHLNPLQCGKFPIPKPARPR
jgi:hypothetical protein